MAIGQISGGAALEEPPPGPYHPNAPRESKTQDPIFFLQEFLMFLLEGYSGCQDKTCGTHHAHSRIPMMSHKESYHGNFLTFGHIEDGKWSQKSWMRPPHGWKNL